MQREYPPLLRDAGISGDVTLRFTVDAEGRAGDVRVVQASHETFDAAARRVVGGVRFPPGAGRLEARMGFRMGAPHEVELRPFSHGG